MRIACAGLTALCLWSGAALAAPPAEAVRAFGPMDLFALQQAQDPQIRPDGVEVAYVRAAADVMTDDMRRSIWSVDARTGAQVPLAAGTGQAFSPRWSPDGSRLAYVAVQDGRRQIRVLWRGSLASAPVCDLPEAPRDLVWSPDGRRIAFTMLTEAKTPTLGAPLSKPEGAKWAEPLRIADQVTYRFDGQGYLKPGFDHLYVVDAAGGAPRQLTFGPFNERGAFSFTPDGRALVFSGARDPGSALRPANGAVFRLDLASLDLVQLTHATGRNQAPAVSPDGRQIAYLAFQDRRRGYENLEVRLMDADGARDRSITAGLDRSVDRVQWRADGRALLIEYVDHGVTRIAELAPSGAIRPIASGTSGQELDRPYSGGGFSAARDGTVAFSAGGPQEPGDVALARPGAPPRTLTTLNADLFQARRLGRVEALPVRSSFDGQPIDAWMITPPDYDPTRRYPLLLEIHGGPFASYGPVFASELQLYASAGYVVVYANPRGSTSYGFAFADAINYDYPSHDYDDLMSVVDAAVARPFVDPKNLFVTGGSGGGLLTAWIVGKNERFRAAAAQKPVINWTSELLTMDSYAELIPDWFGKPPWEDQAHYWSRSPLSLVGSVKTPTLVMVGTDDFRTPPSEAEQFYQALKFRQVPTVLVRVPGASHGGLAARPSQEAAEAAAILAWFDRYRTPAP